MSNPEEMCQCQMTNCGYIYDPAHGDKKGKIPKGTRFEDLPDDWKCPCCGVQQGHVQASGRPGIGGRAGGQVLHVSRGCLGDRKSDRDVQHSQ